jgi:hypothetical protein
VVLVPAAAAVVVVEVAVTTTAPEGVVGRSVVCPAEGVEGVEGVVGGLVVGVVVIALGPDAPMVAPGSEGAAVVVRVVGLFTDVTCLSAALSVPMVLNAITAAMAAAAVTEPSATRRRRSR